MLEYSCKNYKQGKRRWKVVTSTEWYAELVEWKRGWSLLAVFALGMWRQLINLFSFNVSLSLLISLSVSLQRDCYFVSYFVASLILFVVILALQGGSFCFQFSPLPHPKKQLLTPNKQTQKKTRFNVRMCVFSFFFLDATWNPAESQPSQNVHTGK